VARAVADHYMSETFEYLKLSALHSKVAELYRKIRCIND
jgi:hypothetical protein